jgi:hypothetical protein
MAIVEIKSTTLSNRMNHAKDKRAFSIWKLFDYFLFTKMVGQTLAGANPA